MSRDETDIVSLTSSAVDFDTDTIVMHGQNAASESKKGSTRILRVLP